MALPRRACSASSGHRTRGYHLAAYSITLTVLAAPLDDLWHRTFGLDVTLWSPPHLLGLVGGILNAAACWAIACEAYPAGSRGRLVALVVAGALVYGGISLGLQPAIRIAYVYGGLWFFMYPLLAALLAPLALVVTAHLSRLRAAPVLVVVTVFVIGLAGAGVSRAGFAWVQPESFLADEIVKADVTQKGPGAIAHSPPPACPSALAWAALLQRVFALDVLHCSRCGGRRRILKIYPRRREPPGPAHALGTCRSPRGQGHTALRIDRPRPRGSGGRSARADGT